MEKAKTMTVLMNENRVKFGEMVQALEVEGFEFRGRTEKGFLFSDSDDHFVTVSVTAHKWETPTTAGYDGLGMLEEYEDKQLEKAEKDKEKALLKAKKIAEKEKKEVERKAKKERKEEEEEKENQNEE